MAVLSAIPAVGMVPWFLRRVRHPYVSIIFAAMLVLAAKLSACVVARIVYGPDYIEQGYVSADWRSAKLMISLFWSFSTLLSVGLLLADYRTCKRAARIDAVTKEVAIRSSAAAGGRV
jgi:H+/Cl- antiporter ClcA